MRIEEKVARKLIYHQKTIATAESCTGGLLSHRLTNIPGSSDYLKAGVITYSNEAKIQALKVPSKLLKKHGAVSSEVATRMAKGVRDAFESDFGISITGIAGPDGGSKQKPVGLVFIAVNTPEETLCYECRFFGSRLSIKKQASTMALNLLLEFLA